MPEEFTPEEHAILAESPADTSYILDEDEASPVRRFTFRFTPLYRAGALPFGVTPGRAGCELDGSDLRVWFGPWKVTTPLANVVGVETVGPFSIPKTIGPAHLSFADRGLTFATNPDRGVCVTFSEPITGIEPFKTIRHPGLTVTVADCDGLVETLESRT